jgi:hypothetical protein
MENRLYKTRYGAWGGRPSGNPPDFTRCCYEVFSSERGVMHHQCANRRNAGPDKAYCKVHDPEAVKARAAASDRKYRDETNRQQVQWHGSSFLAALRQIADGHNDPRSLAREVIEKYEGSLR